MKKGGNTVKIVTDLVMPLIEEQNLILWDVRFEKEGSMWLLRVIIDKEGGISVDDCEALSRPLDKLLDEVDPIEQSYCLEVASAGLERDLTKDWHYEKSIGQKVVAKTIRPIEGQREFIGVLKSYQDHNIILVLDSGDEINFQKSEAAYIRWYVEF